MELKQTIEVRKLMREMLPERKGLVKRVMKLARVSVNTLFKFYRGQTPVETSARIIKAFERVIHEVETQNLENIRKSNEIISNRVNNLQE